MWLSHAFKHMRAHGSCFLGRSFLLFITSKMIIQATAIFAFCCFQDVYNEVFCDTGNYMQIFHTDEGGEFNKEKFQEYLSQKGIRHIITRPYSPEQNDFCEQDNHTVMESVWSLLHSSGYPLSFWAEDCHTTVYTLNRTSSQSIPGNTPFISMVWL